MVQDIKQDGCGSISRTSKRHPISTARQDTLALQGRVRFVCNTRDTQDYLRERDMNRSGIFKLLFLAAHQVSLLLLRNHTL